MKNTPPQGTRTGTGKASTNGQERVRTDSHGRGEDHPQYNPFDNPGAGEKHREAADADQKRIEKWAAQRFPVTALDGWTWARSIRAQLARRNATRDPVTDTPKLIFAGDMLVKAGATDEQLEALGPELTVEQIEALQIRAAAIRADCREQVNETAKLIASERTIDTIRVEWTDLTTHVPDPQPWVVPGLMRRRAVNAVLGERKAGKTHLIADLAGAALDHRPFLGKYPVNLPADAEVVLFDTEMDADDLHELYTENGTKNLDRLRLASLRGIENRFDVRLPAVVDYWRDRIAPGSLIIFDCLYSLLIRLGIDESSPEVGGIITALRALAVQCDAAGLLIAHHLGKDPTKGARGHSSIEGSVDAWWTVELDGPPAAGTPRTFSAFGRSKVSADPRTLTRRDDGRLFVDDDEDGARRRDARIRALSDKTWALIEEHPGLSEAALTRLPIEARKNLSGRSISAGIKALREANPPRIVNISGRRDRFSWHAVMEPAAGLHDPMTVVHEEALPTGPEADAAHVQRLIWDHPGKSGRALGKLAVEVRGEITQKAIYAAIAELSDNGLIVNKGDDEAPLWYVADAAEGFAGDGGERGGEG